MDASSKLTASTAASGKHTPGPWLIATSNSWRRIVSRDSGNVCEPIKQNDGHPDLHFKNGGPDGPDACLLAAAPDLLEACEEALNAFVGCAIPAGGVDDRKHILDAQMALRKAINKAYDHQG